MKKAEKGDKVMKINKKAAERLRRLLNFNFKNNECEIEIGYKKSVKNRRKNGRQVID